MKQSTIIWIVVAIVVILAVYFLFFSKPAVAAPVRTGQSAGNLNTNTAASNSSSSWLQSLFPYFNTVNSDLTKGSSSSGSGSFKQTPPVINGCDANHLDKDGFLCVDDGNGGWMPYQ